MPYAADKIRLNGGGLAAFSAIVAGYFNAIAITMASSEQLGDEIEERGWLKEEDALVFLQQQVADCLTVDKACGAFIKALAKYHANQMDRNERMRIWIDSQLSKQS